MSDPSEATPRTVLVYSDDPGVRERLRLAIGRRPAVDVGPVRFVEAADEPEAVRAVAAGGVDLAVLDGEAWPAGGLGISRQLKDEVADCPPTVVVVGRRDDRWLATWSRADAVLAHPVDPVAAAEAVADLLRGRSAVTLSGR